MSALAQRPGGPAPPADNDIYTALLAIATVFVAAATVWLAYQFNDFYGFDTFFQGVLAPGK